MSKNKVSAVREEAKRLRIEKNLGLAEALAEAKKNVGLASEQAKPKELRDLPEWLAETPEMRYRLEADSDNGIEQLVELTLDEYNHLKEIVAAMRGVYGPAEGKQVLDCLRKKFDQADLKEAA